MVWFGLEYRLIFTSELPLTWRFNETFNVHKDPNLKITENMDIFAYLLVDAILNRVEKIRNE